MVVEKLHEEAIQKHRNLNDEKTRNPRINLCKNMTLSILTSMIMNVLCMIVFGMFMWICIKLTDEVFMAEKWYWQVLSFFLGYILGTIEIMFVLVGITYTLQIWKNQYEKRYKKRAPMTYLTFQVVTIIINFGIYIYASYLVAQIIIYNYKTRDFVMIVIHAACMLLYSLHANCNPFSKEPGMFSFEFPSNKERIPLSF